MESLKSAEINLRLQRVGVTDLLVNLIYIHATFVIQNQFQVNVNSSHIPNIDLIAEPS